VLAALGAFLIAKRQAEGPSEVVTPPPAGLPDTPDYHSLLVDPADPNRVVLGTHAGLYESKDGGRSWKVAQLQGQDAMNLARASEKTVWAAGHSVLAKSEDGGSTWTDVRPEGLPGLDVHGFATDPRDPNRLFAAVAGQGLYRSTDAGKTFELVSRGVGPNVMALAVTADGRVLAGDMQTGLMVSEDGGTRWRPALQTQVMGLAVNPSDSQIILAAGPGLLRSTDGGQSWNEVHSIPEGAGPVAWSPSDPKIAYAVGFDRRLYRSHDTGATWQPVG
jgi:photosystem II stability/assembly factor-like uncharacterized protein